MSEKLTAERVYEYLRTSAGITVPEGTDPETPFTDLGADSLAVLEVATQVQQSAGVPIPDEDVEGLKTPAAFVAYVNDHLARV